MPTREELCRWHARLYAGCDVPVAGYVGHFRGDPAVRELVDYEVGLGAPLKDGNLEKMGVWANRVNEEMAAVLAGLHAVFAELDARLPVGQPPGTADEILQVISFAALAHGECLRVHPFANGNGRIARLLVAFICLRYAAADVLAHQATPRGRGLCPCQSRLDGPAARLRWQSHDDDCRLRAPARRRARRRAGGLAVIAATR